MRHRTAAWITSMVARRQQRATQLCTEATAPFLLPAKKPCWANTWWMVGKKIKSTQVHFSDLIECSQAWVQGKKESRKESDWWPPGHHEFSKSCTHQHIQKQRLEFGWKNFYYWTLSSKLWICAFGDTSNKVDWIWPPPPEKQIPPRFHELWFHEFCGACSCLFQRYHPKVIARGRFLFKLKDISCGALVSKEFHESGNAWNQRTNLAKPENPDMETWRNIYQHLPHWRSKTKNFLEEYYCLFSDIWNRRENSFEIDMQTGVWLEDAGHVTEFRSVIKSIFHQQTRTMELRANLRLLQTSASHY